MKYKKYVLAILIAISITLSGCTYGQTNVENLLTPPKLSDIHNEIYSALQATEGNDVRLKYPRKGEYKSAFIIQNLDEEQSEEAIVFYERSNNAQSTVPLRISLLDNVNGKWVSVCDVGVEATEVEKVYYLNKEDGPIIIAGFNLPSSTDKLIVAFKYQNNMLEQIFTATCANFEIADLNNDGAQELIVINSKKDVNNVKVTVASIYDIGTYGIQLIDYTHMDPNVVSYINILKGKLPDGSPALYIDGTKGSNNVVTEILTVKKSRLVNLVYNQDEDLNKIDKTLRTNSFSTDINSDGVIEIPTTTPAPGYEYKPNHQKLYFTFWHNFVEDKFVKIKTSYVDYSMSYMFNLPEQWENKVTVEYNPGEKEVQFFDVDILNKIDSLLLTIKMVNRNEYLSNSFDQGYMILDKNGQLIYTFKLHQTSSKIQIKDNDVYSCFRKI